MNVPPSTDKVLTLAPNGDRSHALYKDSERDDRKNLQARHCERHRKQDHRLFLPLCTCRKSVEPYKFRSRSYTGHVPEASLTKLSTVIPLQIQSIAPKASQRAVVSREAEPRRRGDTLERYRW